MVATAMYYIIVKAPVTVPLYLYFASAKYKSYYNHAAISLFISRNKDDAIDFDVVITNSNGRKW